MNETLKQYKKPLLILMVVIIIFVIVLLFMYVFSNKKTNLSYSDLKNTILTAATNYCDKNCFTMTENTITLSTLRLSDEGYMKPIADLAKDNTSCTGEVTITKSISGYNYITNLDCGDKYQDKTIDEKIEQDNPVDTANLFQIGNKLVFKGDYPNNYLQLGDTLFRIVNINEDKTITLTLANYDRETTSVWDDRYNSSVNKTVGINNYSLSRAKEHLQELLTTTYKTTINNKALARDYCIGTRDANDTNNNYPECSSTINDYISLLTTTDIINASNDSNCNSIANSASCQNYNYLMDYNAYWLMTTVKDTTEKIYSVSTEQLNLTYANNRLSLRFVITISGNEIYKSGTGTETDPYILETNTTNN